jgi:hypothetical protein
MSERIINFEGRRIRVPVDATDDEVSQILSSSAPAAPAAPGSPEGAAPVYPPTAAPKQSLGDYAAETGAIGLRQGRGGLATILGAPVDLTNAIMGSFLPQTVTPGTVQQDQAAAQAATSADPGSPEGMVPVYPPRPVSQGVPVSKMPFMGAEMIDAILGSPNRAIAAATGMDPNRAVEGPQPRDAFQRVIGRIGKEMGANVLPLAGAIAGGARVGAQGARVMQNQGVGSGILGKMFEAGAVNPAGLAGRETAYAGAAGLGAGVANEYAGNPQNGDNFWSDLLGSLAGVFGANAAGGIAKGSVGVGRAVLGKEAFRTNVAEQAVAEDIMANSSRLQQQHAQRGSTDRVDTTDLVRDLRRPSAAEEAVPGFRANIADRAQDPGLDTFALNREGGAPGAARNRRIENKEAIDDRMTQLDPSGDPAQFRAALESNRASRIAAAEAEAEQARQAFEAASREVMPGMADATARGSSVRAALADAYAAAQEKVRQAYAPINEATVEVDIAPLADRFAATRDALPLNDRQRFLPSEAGVPEQLTTAAQPAQASTILGPDGAPIMRPEVPASGRVPFNQVTSIRGGLTDDVRAARAAPGQAQKARVTDQFRQQTDEFIDEAVPPELRSQYDAARETRRDVADRFERPGTGMQQSLQTRDGGGYQLDDSAVARTFTPTDQGNVTDFRAAIKEAGTDPRLRSGLADEVLSQAQRSGVINDQQALNKFLNDRNIVLSEFPELRQKLGAAGAARGAADATGKAADTTRRDLTTPSRSPEAKYLQYGDEATVDAVRAITTSPTPGAAMKQLIESAGGTPEARKNARAALWEVVKQQRNDGKTGPEWSGRKLRAMFDDPKTLAAAKEAWADDPEDLANIRKVFDALAKSERSTGSQVPGTSGTGGQLLSSGFDARSISSSIRSVNQGRSSPISEFLYQAQGKLRQMSAKAQKGAIDDLTNRVINNPGLAADLLEKYNPVDFAAKGRMISQKYGLRTSAFFNALDEDSDPDADVKRAITRPSDAR